MSSPPLDERGQIPMDALIAVAVASYRENGSWYDWDPNDEGNWDAIVGDIAAEIDRREIEPLKARLARVADYARDLERNGVAQGYITRARKRLLQDGDLPVEERS